MTQTDLSTTDPKAADEIFFDGACPICRREIAAYKTMSGLREARWTDVSDPATLPQDLDRDVALARLHVRTTDGQIIDGFRAFLAIWRRNPKLRWAARALDRRPLTDLGELAYIGFLKLRPLWRKASPAR